MGQEDQKPNQKPKRGGLPAGLIVRMYTPPGRSWLAGDGATPANPAPPDTPPSLASQLPQKSKNKSKKQKAKSKKQKAKSKKQKAKSKKQKAKSKKQKAKSKSRVHLRSSPLIRPSVSSPAALDLDSPAPSEG
jgi:outer membrane biosynthesis protein TonB